jgi:hypothetical protein
MYPEHENNLISMNKANSKLFQPKTWLDAKTARVEWS